MKNSIDLTKKIHEQITESTWHKGCLHKYNDNMQPVSSCMVGWIERLSYNTRQADVVLYKKFRVANNIPSNTMLSDINDNPDTTFEQVRQMFVKADM